MADTSDLARIFKIPNILEPSIQINTAVEADPQGGTFVDVWEGTGNIWFAKIDTLNGMFSDTWLQAFRWTNPLFGVPFAIQRYPFDVKKKIFGIEASYYQDEKVVSSDLAIRVSSLIST